MDDYVDYMSDEILQMISQNEEKLSVQTSANGNVGTRKRIRQSKGHNNGKHVKLNTKMEIKRNEGLETPISSSNIGHKLLTKMGYKPGKGLGKLSNGINQPLRVDVRPKYLGLGKKTTNEIRKTIVKAKQNYLKHKQQEYMHRTAAEFSNQSIVADLNKCVKIQKTLDESANIVIQEDDNEDTQGTDLDKLIAMLVYLRNVHNYCVYCATKYNDEVDLNTNCPGRDRQDH